ncbi:MAG: alginate O-acetyltransferase AlgX-related protein [Alphaproteobacteria bacterium]
MAVFLGLAGFIALPALLNSHGRSGVPSAEDLVRGTWSKTYEKYFTENLPVYEPFLHSWGTGEFKLFGEGRRGVLIGDDGWLFSAEEFEYPRKAGENFQKNISYIEGVQKNLSWENIKLIVALVPAKARIHQNHLGRYKLPAYRQGLYEEALEYLNAHNIAAVNLMGLQKSENAFLRTDTHWSQEGAHMAATIIAGEIKRNWSTLKLARTDFTRENAEKIHEGDLVRYIPGNFGLKEETIEITTLSAKNTEAEDLFSDANIATVLVGTSYSAGKLWGFENALKEILRTDILNVSDEAIGPFQSMKNYLESDDFKSTTPKIIIWEIPERYLPL